MALTLEQRKQWNEDGYFVVRGLFPPEVVERIRERVICVAEDFWAMRARGEKTPGDLILEPDVETGRIRPENALAGTRKIGHITAHDEELQNLCGRHPAVVEILRDMIGDNVSAVMGALFAKPALIGSETPWHQDLGLWWYPLSGTVSLWTPLDTCTKENGCMQFWKGSHKGGLVEHKIIPGKIQEALPDEAVNMDEVEFVEMEPGDGVFFGELLWHKSGANTSAQRRLGISIVYAGHENYNRGWKAGGHKAPPERTYRVIREGKPALSPE